MKPTKIILILLLIIVAVIFVTVMIFKFPMRFYKSNLVGSNDKKFTTTGTTSPVPTVKDNVIWENADIELIGGIPDESVDSPKPKILSKEKVIGYFTSAEWGDYRHLNIKDLDGNELSFFISTDINMETLSEIEENPEMAKKKIELTWYKVEINVPEAGGVMELDVAMHVRVIE